MNQTINKIIYISSILFIIICIFLIGFFSKELYNYYSYQKQFNGLWIDYNYTHPEAIEKAKQYDKYGYWICINIRDMTAEEAINTIKHEVGHEIYANFCVDDFDKCLNYTNIN